MVKIVSYMHGLPWVFECNNIQFKWDDWVLAKIVLFPGNIEHRCMASCFREAKGKISALCWNPTWDGASVIDVNTIPLFKVIQCLST